MLRVANVWVADGHKLGFDLIDPKTGKAKRMMLILVLDWASRYPVRAALILLEGIFVAIGLVWLDNLFIQSICLLSYSIFLAVRKSWAFVYKELRGLAPFLLGWVAVYGAFALLGTLGARALFLAVKRVGL